MGLSSITLRQRFSAARPSLSDLRMLVQRCVPFARAQRALAPNDAADYLAGAGRHRRLLMALRRGTVFYGLYAGQIAAEMGTRGATAGNRVVYQEHHDRADGGAHN